MNPENRRGFLKKSASYTLSFVSGLLVGSIVSDKYWDSQKTKKLEMNFEPLDLIGDGYEVKTIKKNAFQIFDTRSTTNNQLPPDRKTYLFTIAQKLQNDFGCDIQEIKPDEWSHTLYIKVTNPDCLYEARKKMQLPSTK